MDVHTLADWQVLNGNNGSKLCQQVLGTRRVQDCTGLKRMPVGDCTGLPVGDCTGLMRVPVSDCMGLMRVSVGDCTGLPVGDCMGLMRVPVGDCTGLMRVPMGDCTGLIWVGIGMEQMAEILELMVDGCTAFYLSVCLTCQLRSHHRNRGRHHLAFPMSYKPVSLLL